jgi:tetratricopeptide (TPR) repeat protein
MLQDGLAYYMASDGRIHIGAINTFPENFRTSSKQSQRADLKRVESTYESLLIQETQFPKASQTNIEVEQWVEQAMKNWRIISGFGWTDAEIGQGGKESVSRTMLDILYRAATKTFHSTAVLRELFHVHASLGEFDLAMHAFDSYVDIIGKGKARAQKTGQHQDGIDDDDTAVLTGVEVVRVLCRYGDRSQAEKAVAVGKNLQLWLGEGRPQSSAANGEQTTTANQQHAVQLRASTLAAAYRAIGMSQAQWARLTYDTDARPGLQDEALKHLRRAEAQEPDNIETCFALSSLLAETRDVNAAIVSIRRILAAKPDNTSDGHDDGVKDYTRQRKLVPLWHLLALCLSAKDQHEAAYKMCEAALEQFGDKTVLFGKAASLGGNVEKRSDVSRGLVDQMDSFEKEAIVQIKMTELTLTELTEGPSTAVDMTDELLGLYARLFGKPEETKAPKSLPAVPSATPTRTGGTLRSIAGSIRPRTNRNSIERSRPRAGTYGSTLEPATANGQVNTTNDLGPPIAITVTNEDGTQADRGRGRQEHRHLPFKLRNSMAASRSRSRSLGGKSRPLPNENDQPPLPPPKDYPVANVTADQKPVTSAVNTSNQTNAQQPLTSIAHNSGHADWPAPAGHNEQPPQQDVRLPASHSSSSAAPVPSFSLAQQQRHQVSVLVKVWLFIAELYVRAESLDDAAGAIQEAHKLVESFEAKVAAVESSARAFYSKTWGGGNSVDELWADVLSSVSESEHL